MPFELLNVRDRDNLSYRDAGSDLTKRAVEVENSSLNPIPVFITAGSGDDVINEYDEVLGVVASTLTTLVSYTVPVGKTLGLRLAEASGTNLATYTVVVDGDVIASKRTWWGSDFNAVFEFNRLEIAASSIVQVKVIHERPMNGDFEARINGVLV